LDLIYVPVVALDIFGKQLYLRGRRDGALFITRRDFLYIRFFQGTKVKGQTILMLGYSDWDHWRPTHELARIFSHDNLVIFVERLLGYDDLRWKGVKRIDCLKRLGFKRLRKISENLFVIQSPPGLPSSISFLSRFVDKEIKYFSNYFGKILQGKWLMLYLQSRGIMPTVLFLNHPTDLHLVGRFRERVSCWRVYDEIAIGCLEEGYRTMLSEIEKKYLSRIDMVFASSRTQYTKRKNIRPNVFFVPNAVDFQRFQAVLDADVTGPNDLKSIPRPRIGYIGNIEYERLDFELLERIAEVHPEWSLVLIGWINKKAAKKAKSLAEFKNVHILEYKPHAKIPAYLNGFDVGLIPFRITAFSNAMNPIKLYEYLAAGLPIVSTKVHELKTHSELINIAGNADEFVELIEKTLKNNSAEKVQKRVSFARCNSWDKRAEEMSKVILESLH